MFYLESWTFYTKNNYCFRIKNCEIENSDIFKLKLQSFEFITDFPELKKNVQNWFFWLVFINYKTKTAMQPWAAVDSATQTFILKYLFFKKNQLPGPAAACPLRQALERHFCGCGHQHRPGAGHRPLARDLRPESSSQEGPGFRAPGF